MFDRLRDQVRGWLRPVSPVDIEHVARVVAHESIAQVRQRMSGVAQTMNRNQRAGYVRARARRVVEYRVECVSRLETSATSRAHGDVVNKSLDLVVQLLCREAMLRTAPEVVRRRAA